MAWIVNCRQDYQPTQLNFTMGTEMFDIRKPITTLAEVKSFANYLFTELQVIFHPDDDFADYADRETGDMAFKPEIAETLNLRMCDCFVVCDNVDADIYEVMDVISPFVQGLIDGDSSSKL